MGVIVLSQWESIVVYWSKFDAYPWSIRLYNWSPPPHPKCTHATPELWVLSSLSLKYTFHLFPNARPSKAQPPLPHPHASTVPFLYQYHHLQLQSALTTLPAWLCPRRLKWVLSLGPHKNPMNQVLLLLPLYSWSHWGSERRVACPRSQSCPTSQNWAWALYCYPILLQHMFLGDGWMSHVNTSKSSPVTSFLSSRSQLSFTSPALTPVALPAVLNNKQRVINCPRQHLYCIIGHSLLSISSVTWLCIIGYCSLSGTIK